MSEEQKPFRQRVADGLKAAKAVASRAVQAAKDAAQGDLFGKFKSGSTEIDFQIDLSQETVWATYEQMAALFGTQPQAIVKHVANVYAAGELDRETTSSKLELVRTEGDRQVRAAIEHFNLDMILSVGYRVSGPKATEFRKWASHILKNYIVDGYALNGKRLAGDPAALFKLAQEVRALRNSEKSRYEQVREAFKLCSLDYDKDAPEAQKFFAQSQDMFHYAVSEATAAQIVYHRCDASKPAMGMLSLGNKAPTFADGCIAKNYLTSDELRAMEILGEQWLLYAEGMAQRGKQVSMARLLAKLQEIVAVNEFSVFPGYDGKITRAKANERVREQLSIFKAALPKPKAA